MQSLRTDEQTKLQACLEELRDKRDALERTMYIAAMSNNFYYTDGSRDIDKRQMIEITKQIDEIEAKIAKS